MCEVCHGSQRKKTEKRMEVHLLRRTARRGKRAPTAPQRKMRVMMVFTYDQAETCKTKIDHKRLETVYIGHAKVTSLVGGAIGTRI